MSPILIGILAGLACGSIEVGLMLPMEFPDKRTALMTAFTSRFAIGFSGCVCQNANSCLRDWCACRPTRQHPRCNHHQGLHSNTGHRDRRARDHRVGVLQNRCLNPA